MGDDCGGIFGLTSLWPWDIGRLLHSPNIVGDFGYGWAICYHGRKLRKACARVLLMYWKITLSGDQLLYFPTYRNIQTPISSSECQYEL